MKLFVRISALDLLSPHPVAFAINQSMPIFFKQRKRIITLRIESIMKPTEILVNERNHLSETTMLSAAIFNHIKDSKREKNRVLVYSHDTFGLGNIRRMLSICEHLLADDPAISILLITGSPMIHDMRIPDRLDYIKLPCLSRNLNNGYSVKSLHGELKTVVKLRSDLIYTTVTNYKPDVFVIDKKPFGVENELEPAIEHLHKFQPDTKLVLLLRDILDDPKTTQNIWKKNGYHEAIDKYYDLLLVAGNQEIFNACKEYRFPPSTVKKVRFCGYIERKGLRNSRSSVRQELQIDKEKLILVTVGGGQDGFNLLNSYINGLKYFRHGHNTKSLIITGSELSPTRKGEIFRAIQPYSSVQIKEFTKDIVNYMEAADLIISMGGYNTICEILSLKKRAIVVPRINPVLEQWIRAERMAEMGLIRAIHPDNLSPEMLASSVMEELAGSTEKSSSRYALDLNALPKMTSHIKKLFSKIPSLGISNNFAPQEFVLCPS